MKKRSSFKKQQPPLPLPPPKKEIVEASIEKAMKAFLRSEARYQELYRRLAEL